MGVCYLANERVDMMRNTNSTESETSTLTKYYPKTADSAIILTDDNGSENTSGKTLKDKITEWEKSIPSGDFGYEFITTQINPILDEYINPGEISSGYVSLGDIANEIIVGIYSLVVNTVSDAPVNLMLYFRISFCIYSGNIYFNVWNTHTSVSGSPILYFVVTYITLPTT